MTTSQTVSFQVGDRVVFARSFLQSTGMLTGWAPFAVGSVVADATIPRHQMRGRQLLHVMWDGMTEAQAVLSVNLWHKDRRHLEPV